jgi:hypothetical protein
LWIFWRFWVSDAKELNWASLNDLFLYRGCGMFAI